MRIHDVVITPSQLSQITFDHERVVVYTEQGSRIAFYPPDTKPVLEEGTWNIPMASLMLQELESNATTGYARDGMPFALSIRLGRNT
jgi:hypothetical protein